MGATELNITLILVILTGFISWQGFRNPEFANKLLHIPYRVKHQKEYIRLLGAGFVHGNWMHLLVNLYVLYQFGGVVELLFGYLFGPAYGLVVYVLFYLTSIVISSLPAYFRHQDNPGYGELGASGGHVGAGLYLHPDGPLAMVPVSSFAGHSVRRALSLVL
ncbi:MAG: rhomboid family intramembrane serine protease [Haliscomenobacter sp.]|nr:rhomboid family intramembrane serine protease [Haliscomenobacter sp.]